MIALRIAITILVVAWGVFMTLVIIGGNRSDQ